MALLINGKDDHNTVSGKECDDSGFSRIPLCACVCMHRHRKKEKSFFWWDYGCYFSSFHFLNFSSINIYCFYNNKSFLFNF